MKADKDRGATTPPAAVDGLMDALDVLSSAHAETSVALKRAYEEVEGLKPPDEQEPVPAPTGRLSTPRELDGAVLRELPPKGEQGTTLRPISEKLHIRYVTVRESALRLIDDHRAVCRRGPKGKVLYWRKAN